MTQPVSSFIKQLALSGVRLEVEGDNLRYISSQGPIASHHVDGIRNEKLKLIYFLRSATGCGFPINGATSIRQPSLLQQMWWDWVAGVPSHQCRERLSVVKYFREIEPQNIIDNLKRLVQKHEVLRWSFTGDSSSLSVSVNDIDGFEVEVSDYTHSSQNDASISAEIILFRETALPVTSKWLIRAKLIYQGRGNSALILVANHIITDNVSFRILMRELELALMRHTPIELRNGELEFKDFSSSERKWFESNKSAPFLNYWRNWILDQPTIFTPINKEAIDWRPGDKIEHYFELPVLNGVYELANLLSVSPFTVLLTLFGLAMCEWSDCNRMPMRSVSNMRSHPALANMVGFMSCADPICFHGDSQDFATLVDYTAEEHLSALERRIPSFLRFPPILDENSVGEIDFPKRIPATINFFSNRSTNVKHTVAVAPDRVWPPKVQSTPAIFQPRPFPPVYLNIWDDGTTPYARLHLNQSIISEHEQKSLLAALFENFQRITKYIIQLT